MKKQLPKSLPIVQVPHERLREKAQPITTLDQPLIDFITQLKQTLSTTKNPPGVGLAAPQVDSPLSVFATYLPPDTNPDAPSQLAVYINPTVESSSRGFTFGPDPDDPILEGCLSIPKLYGPVPRHEWIVLHYQTIEDDALVWHSDRFEQFSARVIQHELDHLHGVLFTDYSLRYELPVYQRNPTTRRFEEVDTSILTLF